MAEKLFQQLEAEAHASARVLEGPQTPSPSPLNAYAVDWASPQRRTPDSSGWEHQQAASMSAMAVTPAISINTGANPAAEVDDRRLSSGSFGDMPTHLAEQVGVLMPPLLCMLSCSCNDVAASTMSSAIAVHSLPDLDLPESFWVLTRVHEQIWLLCGCNIHTCGLQDSAGNIDKPGSTNSNQCMCCRCLIAQLMEQGALCLMKSLDKSTFLVLRTSASSQLVRQLPQQLTHSLLTTQRGPMTTQPPVDCSCLSRFLTPTQRAAAPVVTVLRALYSCQLFPHV